MEINTKDKFRLVGNLTKFITRSDSVDAVLIESMGFLSSFGFADFAIAWVRDGDSDILRPYFSVSPLELTSKQIKIGKGIVGRVYDTSESIWIRDYNEFSSNQANEEDAREIKNVFEDLKISSMICVPIVLGETVGCIQCIISEKDRQYDNEDYDILNLFSNTLTYYLEETDNISMSWNFPNIIISGRNIVKEVSNADNILRILKGVNINVYEGEFLVLLGESGCGKTTLLNILGGLDSLTSGELLFMSQDLTKMNEAELTQYRRENIGFVFQNYNLMPNINVRQNIDLIAELVDKPIETKDVLDLVKIGDKEKNYPSQMSGGQQQRVSIARAVVKNPRIIMADEPTAALDYETSIGVLNVFEDIVSKGSTLVMVTHNEEIAKMANRIIRIRNGQVFNIQINPNPVKANHLVW